MAFLQMQFRSEALNQSVSVNILLPAKVDGKFKTLWLLHGLSGDQSDWMRYTSVERYAKEYGLAVVMPNVGRSWYTDTAYGQKYFTFVTRELPDTMAAYFKGYSPAREDNLIIGLSMGGYGALKAALTLPEQYHFCASLSGSLDITRKGRTCNLAEWRAIFGFDLEKPDDLEGTQHDIFVMARNCKNPPEIYMWCGTEDILIHVNKRFSSHLFALDIPHTFAYSEGDHTWGYWDLHLQSALADWKEKTEG